MTKKQFRLFKDARSYVQALHLKNQNEWRKYCNSKKKPSDIPTSPDQLYKEWTDWGDWLGTGTVATSVKAIQWRSFKEAREYAKSLGLKNRNEWTEYVKSDKMPIDIPRYPGEVYKNKGWTGLGNWLGTGTVATFDRKFRSFAEARKFARLLGLKNQNEWRKYCNSKKKPSDIPTSPDQLYKEWTDWGDWLGTGTVASQLVEFLPFEKARTYVHSLALKNQKEWRKYCKSNKKPKDIPKQPIDVYKKEWKGVGDWLGTGTIASQTKSKNWRPFKEAREFIRSLGLKNQAEWINYCKSGKKPHDIPSYPWEVYTKDKKKKRK